MKIKTQLPEPSARESSGPRYWRSLGDLAEDACFQGMGGQGISRRGFEFGRQATGAAS